MVSCSSALNMKATHFSETWVDFEQPTTCYMPKERTLHNHCCENLKSTLVLTAVNINNVVFWVMTQYNLQCFRRTYCLYSKLYSEDGGTMFTRNVGSKYQTTRCNNRDIKLSVYVSPHIDQAMKSARMTWASQAEELGECSVHTPNGVNLR
jgi:hypothetical protein